MVGPPVVTACRCDDPLACDHLILDVALHIADDGMLLEIAVEDPVAHTSVLFLDVPQAKTLALLLTDWADLASNVH